MNSFSILDFTVNLAAGAGLGLVFGFFTFAFYKKSLVKRAQQDAKELLDDARASLEEQKLEEQATVLELETELWGKEEKFIATVEEKIEELQERFDARKSKIDNAYSVERQKVKALELALAEEESHNQKLMQKLQSVRSQKTQLQAQVVESLTTKTQSSKAQVIEEIQKQLIQETERRCLQLATEKEEETKEHSETLAKNLLDRAYSRFMRAFCPERGISGVYFETPEQRKVLLDEKGDNIKLIMELTGCDIVVQPDMDLIGVAGYDPVRRELTRRLLEKLLTYKRPVVTDHIKKAFEDIKRELFRQIKNDGDQLMKELRLEQVHADVKQIMGSLRFRYSFTQNQFFHCAEVGWLCGLLAAELGGTDEKKARRSGVFHDLGKAMDHELDGGHAVLGANFIESKGEAPDVVHAVKAHHYDETPSSDMAFLVIAADAISGARPGARRSTNESYTQKVTDLENIAKSFEGVTECYILSGGRECRVLVNGRRVDDRKALELSAQIAKRIEDECSYPGQIKVVVVRETVHTESTKQHA